MVKKIFYEHQKIPGSTKIAKELRANGISVGNVYIAKIIRVLGLKSKTVKKYKATTNSSHNLPVD